MRKDAYSFFHLFFLIAVLFTHKDAALLSGGEAAATGRTAAVAGSQAAAAASANAASATDQVHFIHLYTNGYYSDNEIVCTVPTSAL